MEPRLVMERQKFTPEFKLEAVKLISRSGVAVARASRVSAVRVAAVWHRTRD